MSGFLHRPGLPEVCWAPVSSALTYRDTVLPTVGFDLLHEPGRCLHLGYTAALLAYGLVMDSPLTLLRR